LNGDEIIKGVKSGDPVFFVSAHPSSVLSFSSCYKSSDFLAGGD
jgi:hypothetical protein